MNFTEYSDCICRAFASHSKPLEIVKRKQEILQEVNKFYNFVPDTILFIGFNPAIMVETANKIYVTEVSTEVKKYLDNNGIVYNYIPRNNLHEYNFDIVVAMDEYFTFAGTDEEQKDLVTDICKVTNEYLLTTCKDYKNQDFKDKEFSIPALIRNETNNLIYLEFHDHSVQNRNLWNTTVYEINNNNTKINGPYARHSMFFKQLAKFSADAGGIGFTIHKNLMYKSLIKKNYEHVISIQFDNYEPK